MCWLGVMLSSVVVNCVLVFCIEILLLVKLGSLEMGMVCLRCMVCLLMCLVLMLVLVRCVR